MAISTIKEAIEDLKKGRMVILVDDETGKMKETSAWRQNMSRPRR